jgi:hypothetical protein
VERRDSANDATIPARLNAVNALGEKGATIRLIAEQTSECWPRSLPSRAALPDLVTCAAAMNH